MIIKYFSPSMAPNTKEDDVQTGSWLCSQESGTDEEMDSKKKNKDLASEFQKSHQGSKGGELLCDKAVPAAKSTPQSSEHMHMYDDWNCVTTRYIYTNFTSRRELCTFSHRCADQLVPVAGHISVFFYIGH